MTRARDVLSLDGASLSARSAATAVRRSAAVRAELAPRAVAAMRDSVRVRDALVAGEIPVYGVTTGFGDSCTRQISPERAHDLQRRLIVYHLNGVGPATAEPVARATMLVRANALARGVSGIRPEVVDTLLRCLAAGIAPVIPERGSVGASGDLVPLCYLAAALIGEGDVRHHGVLRPAVDALADEGIEPVRLEPKEGLALVNGTSYSAAHALLAAWDARELAVAAEIGTAMAYEGLRGNLSATHPFVHAHKAHPGQVASARAIRVLLEGSALTTSFTQVIDRRERIDGRGYVRLDDRIQDNYSLRCAPQKIGVVHDTLDWVERWLDTEINSASDNPLFDAGTGELHLGGNFHAGHVGQAMDALKVAVAGLADLLDRQLALLVDEKFSNGLPPNLVVAREPEHPEAGLHHGFKGMQIAASAVTAEALNRVAPATVFSRSTEAHNQDTVSMAPIAARGARDVCDLVREVTAIHLLAAAQAVDLRGVDRAAPATRRVHALVRKHSAFVDRDRALDHDIAAVVELILDGDLRRAAGLTDDREGSTSR